MAGVESKLVLKRVSMRVDLPTPVSPGGMEGDGGVGLSMMDDCGVDWVWWVIVGWELVRVVWWKKM